MALQALTHTSLPGAFSLDDLNLYRQAWAQPKAYTSMLNWYRAAVQKPPLHHEKAEQVNDLLASFLRD